ncbi:hypothetical protein F4824DRAFT_436807 [Ustulina deusta]|nr:hypothetical protein F4824DRAFT_436807 [Ustulina deusta]
MKGARNKETRSRLVFFMFFRSLSSVYPVYQILIAVDSKTKTIRIPAYVILISFAILLH